MNRARTIGWLKKLGWAGFLFFLIKGLLWLVVGKAAIEFVKSLFS